MKVPFRIIAVLTAALIFAVKIPVSAQTNANPAELDLASDTAWTLRCDDGPARPIKVPGGGWNSDEQSPPIQVMKDVKDYVLYERKITIPRVYAEQAATLRFGAVTYGCEVFLDGRKVGEHHGPQVPFEMDLTDFATPGREQTLQVKAYHRRHYILPGQKQTAEIDVGWDYPEGSDAASRAEAANWCNWHGNSKVGYGIVRSIKVEVLPAVHVEDVFIRTSVAKKELSCDVWVRNATDKDRTLTLGATLSSWNKFHWNYPTIPPVEITVPAKSTLKTTIGPVDWNLGPASYWWPNIPFREDYAAQLHFLNLSLTEGGKLWQTDPRRFGFVEHSEGPYYYMVNGVRVTGISDATAEGQVSFYDAYSSPAWLPPTGPNTGAPESWRRYMRIGININRTHCSPPTEYMMDAADEVGFMLVPEAPIWGNNLSRYNPKYTPQTYHDLGLACRNHPSVARYSLSNEVRDWPDHWSSAIDDMREVDDVHPLVYELHATGHGMVHGPKSGSHAWIMEHYTDIHEKVGEGKGIRGEGENFWANNSMGEYALGARVLRVNDWCYMSGWSWINYWPNFLQGMNHDLHAWKPNDHPDRKDGVDGWGSPIVRFTQQSFDPYLVQDLELLEKGSTEPHLDGDGGIVEASEAPLAASGMPITRNIAVFNGGLFGNQLTLVWSGHWDSPTGPPAVSGGQIPCEIEPGFHATEPVSFTVPALGLDATPDAPPRKLFLVMESRKDGKIVFRDDNTWINVVSHIPEATAAYVEDDDKTQGGWHGKFGGDGYDLIGQESKLPPLAKLEWRNGSEYVFDKACNDPRALAYFANPPTGKDRIAACRFEDDQPLVFTIDAGQTPRRLSIYFLDYDNKGRRQSVEITNPVTGQALDKHEIANFQQGVYQSWKVQNTVKVTIRKLANGSAMLSGIFLDPLSN